MMSYDELRQKVRELDEVAIEVYQTTGMYPPGMTAAEFRDRICALARKGMTLGGEADSESLRLLNEWLKRAEAHRATITEFKGGYQPFLTQATRKYLDSRGYVSHSEGKDG